jgi:hypothetical protein
MNKLLNPEEQKKMVSYGKPKGMASRSPLKKGGSTGLIKTCKYGC